VSEQMLVNTPATLPSRPLHLLIVSGTNTSTHIFGADRDWVNILNALGPERVRISWAGVRGSSIVAQYLDKKLEARYLDLNFNPFYELVYESMYRPRSLRNWAGIILAQFKSVRRSLKQLNKTMRNDPPDLVITNTSVVLIGCVYAFRHRLPHLWFVKEFLDPNVRACRIYGWFIERISDAVVVPTVAITRVFSRKVRVIRDGSDFDSIQESASKVDRAKVLRQLGLPVTQPVLAQVGVISVAKGQEVTARACARLAREGHSPCSLLFLGASRPQDQDELRRILEETPNGWQSSVRFLEFGPGDFSYLASADIVLHPSTIPDPYPNAVREAMILGKPVIAARLGGIPELVSHNITGILVEPDNEVELASAVKRLVDSPEIGAQMGEAGRREAREKWDAERCKDEFFALFREFCSQN
jgi:glycosyltransferase involved in cell wall biosynthesis